MSDVSENDARVPPAPAFVSDGTVSIPIMARQEPAGHTECFAESFGHPEHLVRRTQPRVASNRGDIRLHNEHIASHNYHSPHAEPFQHRHPSARFRFIARRRMADSQSSATSQLPLIAQSERSVPSESKNRLRHGTGPSSTCWSNG